jgi:hypothetical protein
MCKACCKIVLKMGHISINIIFVDGSDSNTFQIGVKRSEQVAILKSGLRDQLGIASLCLDEVRLHFRGKLLDDKDSIAHVDLQNGNAVLALVHKPSRVQEPSSLIDLKMNQRLTVKIVDCYHDKELFLVADETAYALPVCFIGTADVSFEIGMVVSAAYVGAKLKGNKVDFLVLEGAVECSQSSLCALTKPVVLLTRQEPRVSARSGRYNAHRPGAAADALGIPRHHRALEPCSTPSSSSKTSTAARS